MPYTWCVKKRFSREYINYPEDQRRKIFAFTQLFEQYGLDDFSKFEGKLAPSWSGLESSDPIYAYARKNDLWHYHIGIPEYIARHPKYKTSDWILHFQWTAFGPHIDLVDTCYHYKLDGTFYLPDASYLE